MNGAARACAALTAVIAWAALALQFGLLVQRMAADGATIAEAAWRFLGFFTLLTNLLVALVASALASGALAGLAGPRSRLAAATSIAIVGLVYSVALRALWNPTGWQAVADHALHDATPLLFLATWALSDHGRLGWRDALWGTAPAVAYLIYALARGAMDGWYAYWFLDPSTQSAAALATSVSALMVLVLGIALGFVAADRWLGRRLRRPA